MKKILASVACFVFTCALHAQLEQGSVTSSNAPGGRIYFYQYKPPHYSSTTDLLPLIISLHGGGEGGPSTGTDLSHVLNYGLPNLVSSGSVLEFTWQNKTEGFIMLAPQTTAALTADWPAYYVDEMIEYGVNNLHVDRNRVFLTGYSYGGKGVWQYAAGSATNASKLAGIVPAAAVAVSGNPNFCNIGANKVATWVQHSQFDQYGGVSEAIAYTNAVNNPACPAAPGFPPSPVIPAVDSIYPTGGHDIYMQKTYDVTNNSHYPNVFQWMLKVNRNMDVLNNGIPVPIVSGPLSYTFPAPFKAKDFPVLDGANSYDPDDIIMDYLWYQSTGPALSLPRSQWPTTNVVRADGNVGIDPGLYTFVFRVKDYLTSKINSKGNHTQTVTVTVNVTLPASGHAAPATYAGGVITIPSTQTEKTFMGAAYAYGCTDPPFCFSGYNWTQLPANQGGGPPVSLLDFSNASLPYTPGAGEVRIGNIIAPGTYKFQYSATNKFGETGSDILTIVKLGALPVSYSYFNAQNTGGSNVLNWATTAELNSDRFDILRSADGVSFTKIGSETSRGGSLLTTYTFTDNNSAPGVSYYRLSQVDKDGHSSLSQIVSVNNRASGIYVERYPNPTHDNLTVSVQGNTNGNMLIAIADMQGKTILQQQWQKDQSLIKKSINVSALKNGVYQMIITIGNEKKISSFVKY